MNWLVFDCVLAVAVFVAGVAVLVAVLCVFLVRNQRRCLALSSDLAIKQARLDTVQEQRFALQEERYRIVCTLNAMHASRAMELQAVNHAMAEFIRKQKLDPPDDADWWKRGGGRQ